MKHRLHRYAIHVGRVTMHVSRWTLYVSAALLVLLTIIFIVARFTLPMIEKQKSALEQYLSSRSTGHVVRIESLHAYWDGLHPGAQVTGLQVYAPDSRQPAIRLGEVRISLALLPLLWGKLDINSLVVVNPSLALERLADGRFRITGFDPMQAEDNTSSVASLGWLFRQNRIVIENGELRWLDRRAMDTAVHFSHVNLRLENSGDRHRMSFAAQFPPEMCRECSFTLDITGNPLASADWGGDIYLNATEVNIAALPLIAREKLPPTFRGKFTMQLSSAWKEGRPVSVAGNVRVAGLRMPVRGRDLPLGIREASGDLSWRTKGAGWRLDVANPVIGLARPGWPAGHLRIVHQPDESRIEVKHINVDDITAFVALAKNAIAESTKNASAESSRFLDYLLASQPGGAADNIDVRIIGDWTAPEDFFLDADIDNGAVLPYFKYPGVKGLHGHLSLSRRAGELKLDSTNVTVSLPRVFRAPLTARRASGDIKWEKSADHWLINGDKLRVVSDDALGTGELIVRVPLDKAVSPYVKLRVDFENGNGAHAARYYPAPHLSPSTLAWMERSFLGGNITKGYLVYDGPIHDFPFRNHTGKFELRGHAHGAVYQYLPGWEPITQGEVDVAIDNTDVLVTGNGKIGDLDATQIVVHARETDDGGYVVHVTGKVNGQLGETLRVLRDVKPGASAARWLTYVPSSLRGSGEGILSLDLNIPLHEAHSVSINGDYRFLKSTMLFPGAGVAAEGIEGDVHFTEDGISQGNLHTRLLGGETLLTAARDNGQLLIHGEGSVTAQGLATITGAKIAPHLAGKAGWNGTWRGGSRGMGNFYLEANLRGLKATLPPPFDLPNGLPDEKLIIRSESSTPDSTLLSLDMRRYAHGKFVFARTADGWRMTAGRVGFGEGRVPLPLPKDHGLYLSARLDALDIDQWLPLLGAGDAASAAPVIVSRVSADIRSFGMLDRKFGNVSVDFSRDRDTWDGTVNGAFVAGNVKLSGKGPAARFELDLDHLILPDAEHNRRVEETDPRRLPTVVLHSKSFQIRDKQLGALDFMAQPGPSGWLIKDANLTRPEMKLQASGSWLFVNNKPESDFNVEFNSSDMGKTMDAFGLPGQMVGGDVSVKAHLSWPESPANLQLATLSGGIEISAKKGRFLKVKQGAGRLFGVLDLSAIGRYLTLDFSPVFGKGFIFDKINGSVSLEKGNAYTRGFSIHGPATEIDVDGRMGLVAEDYDLTIEVQPKLSDALTIASWGVWGPQVAAVVLAVQKIFKKQISAGTRITYVVKGPWDKPVITKQQKGKEAKTSVSPAKPDEQTTVQ
jgi:uncharacterized protein (TIGR02099 family)